MHATSSRLRAAARAVRRRRLAPVGAFFGLAAGIATAAALRRARERRNGEHPGAGPPDPDQGGHAREDEAHRFLEHATHVIMESIDWEATLARVVQLAVPFLGDFCVVVLKEPAGLRVVAAAHADPARTPELRELLARYPIDPEASHGVAWIVRHARPELVPEMDVDEFAAGSDAGAPLRRQALRAVGARSYLGVPLVAFERTLGGMVFGITAPGRRHGPRDLHIAQELSSHCALAIEHARLYREATDATRTREEVLAIVSHDLRSPIAAVQLAAGLLSRFATSGPPELRKPIEAVKSAAARATRLLDDLVDSARLERGSLTLQRAAHSAGDLAREAAAMAEPVAAAQEVKLSVDVAPEAGAVDADAHRILQVFSNLIGNSLKAMPAGGALRIAVRRSGPDVMFQVTDSGPGIPLADQPHIFERYWRGGDAAYAGAGSGLGLAIARGIVEAHGGRIRVESTPGQGATFTFCLPSLAGEV